MATMSTMQRFTHTLHNRDISLTAFLAHGKPWFCAKDVATPLRYTNTQQAILHNVDEEDRAQLKDFKDLKCLPDCREGEEIFISELGMHSLILSSQTPQAKAMHRWVMNEVLPTIRNTVQYSLHPEVTQKRVELEIAEIDERIQSAKRRCIETGISPMKRCGITIVDADEMQAKDKLHQIVFGPRILGLLSDNGM